MSSPLCTTSNALHIRFEVRYGKYYFQLLILTQPCKASPVAHIWLSISSKKPKALHQERPKLLARATNSSNIVLDSLISVIFRKARALGSELSERALSKTIKAKQCRLQKEESF